MEKAQGSSVHISKRIPRIFAGGLLVFVMAETRAAETLGLWQFDDGAAPNTADTLVSEVNAPAFNGVAKSNDSGPKPVFSDDRPGDQIWAYFSGPILNSSNAGSLRFTNAGLPGAPASHSGGVVEISGNDPALFASNLTVEAFVKVDRVAAFPLVIGKVRNGGTSWNLDFDDNGRPRVRVDSNPTNTPGAGLGWNESTTSPYAITNGQWHHLAFSFTHATRVIRLYVDYAEVASRTAASNLVYDTGVIRIGQGAGGRAFDGWIDEVRITDDVLKPTQFMTVYPPSSTLFYLPFQDGAVGTAANQVTNMEHKLFMNGTAGAINGGTTRPVFSAERPRAETLRVTDGLNGPVVNRNSGSLYFVNIGLPDNANSNSGGVVTVSGSMAPVPVTNFTAEAFVRVDRHIGFPQIIGKRRASTGGLAWSLAYNSSGNLRARFDSQIPPDTAGINQTFESPAQINDGLWHHVALTYDYTTRKAILYKDYVNVYENTTTNPLWLDNGDYQIGAGDKAFDGWIDEVRVSTRVLAPEEFLHIIPIEGTLLRLQ